MYTKTQRLKLLSIVREDDDEDEVDDQSEEINDVNEPEPQRQIKEKKEGSPRMPASHNVNPSKAMLLYTSYNCPLRRNLFSSWKCLK